MKIFIRYLRALFFLWCCHTSLALAKLPTFSAPSGGGNTNIVGTLLGYARDYVGLISLILGAFVFLIVSWHPICDLIDVRKERKDVGQLVGGLAVGGLVAVICFYYLNQVDPVLSGTVGGGGGGGGGGTTP